MHLEALTSEGKDILPKLKFLPDFYLAGGTGLALQLGHRISVDFDFFNEKAIEADLLDELEENIPNLPTKIIVNNKDELTAIVGETKFSFLYYPFPPLLPLADFDNLKIASIPEIAAMKAYTLGRRGTFKDYVDIYFILKGGESLEAVVGLANKKYGEAFDARLFLEQMVYLKDIEDTDIRFLKEEVKKEELERFFEDKIRLFPLK